MKLRIGIVGLGHLGKIHLKCLRSTEFQIVACFDIQPETRDKVSKEYEIPSFEEFDQMLAQVDVVDIVSSTASHFALAEKALLQGKHVFIEKPFVEKYEDGLRLKEIANQNKLIVQLGHVERYNPAVLKLDKDDIDPKFVEAHRLANFNPRGNDVSVVMDLMIHDLDLLCHLIKSEVSTVDANGVAVIEESADICNARIKFKNGAVANLTASRLSLKQMRKFRIFQNDRYVSLDLLNKELQSVSLSENYDANAMEIQTKKGKKYLTLEAPSIEANNAIIEEFNDFHAAIMGKKDVNVSIDDGLRSLRMADMIQESIFANNKKLKN